MDGIAIKAMVRELAPVIREYVDVANAPLLERIASLEAEKTTLAARCEALEAIEAPTLDTAEVEKLVADEIAKLPTPDLAEEMERELAPLKAENEELKARIKVLEDRPAPEVIKGDPGEPGKDGSDGNDGAPGKDGADGSGIADLLRDHEGNLVASFTDGRLKNLGPIHGKDGKDGRDGFGLEDFDVRVLEDDRTIEFAFKTGEHENIATLKWPTVIYRGVFKDGEQYERGDMATWAGSLWHCDEPTKDKPGTDSWTLAAKKGRDGKDAKVG